MQSIYMVFIISWIITLLIQLIVYRVVTRRMFSKWDKEKSAAAAV